MKREREVDWMVNRLQILHDDGSSVIVANEGVAL